ncbi:hypothetical protein Salat_1171100 [Sesamum alatum]|uniref:Uncharacterized protein n=1 Tax=Sesamum alatum TaxID=300844 RepID=A0AAE1YFP3_9LAMI|nr:hypothetical protein Salat_1171100 [Sesamum alatum]
MPMVRDWRAVIMAAPLALRTGALEPPPVAAPLPAAEAPPIAAPLPAPLIGGNEGNTYNRRAHEVGLQLLQSKNPEKAIKISLPDGSKKDVKLVGEVILFANVTLKHVLFITSSRFNLISLRRNLSLNHSCGMIRAVCLQNQTNMFMNQNHRKSTSHSWGHRSLLDDPPEHAANLSG